MGSGASADKKQETKNDEVTPTPQEAPDAKQLQRERDELAKKLNEAEVELDALRKKVKSTEAKKAEAGKSSSIAGGISFEVVVTGEQIEALRKMDGVGLFYVQGEAQPLEERENVVIVSCKKDMAAQVMECISCPPTIERPQKPTPDAPPPPVEKPFEKPSEDEEEKPKIAVPEPDVEAKTDIDMGSTWDGAVPLTFKWIDEPSPFSEFNDPAGQNWSCFTNVRKAVGKPQKIALEWRQGMTGKWTTIEASEEFVATMMVKPEKVESSAYRGFQSRWVVDGDKYLSPLQLAPTLQSKLMTYPTVRKAIKALPADKQSIEFIENENLRKALMTVENIIPMNTWDIDYGVSTIPGAHLNGEHITTIFEKAEMIAKLKSSDPEVAAEIRKTVLKSPIMAADAAAGTVGVKLDMIISNMDFFLPKMTDPDFEQLQSIEQNELLWETMRREMQVDVNELYPTYQSGIRVTFPPAKVLANAMKCKRPSADPNVQIPVTLRFTLESDKVYMEKRSVAFVYWPSDANYETDRVTVALEAPEEKEKFGLKREEKSVWKDYTAVVNLVPGLYRYHWMYEGKPYFSKGRPYTDKYKPGESYQSFSVMCRVQFGIGVAL